MVVPQWVGFRLQRRQILIEGTELGLIVPSGEGTVRRCSWILFTVNRFNSYRDIEPRNQLGHLGYQFGRPSHDDDFGDVPMVIDKFSSRIWSA